MLPIPSLERGTQTATVASINVAGPASTPTKPPPKCWCPIAAPGKLDFCPNSDRLNPGRAFYKCARVPSCSFFAWRDSNEEYKRMKEENNKQSAQPPSTTTTPPAPQQQQQLPKTISLLASEVKASAIAPPPVQAVVRPPTTPATIKILEPLPPSPRILAPRKLDFGSIEKKKKEDKKKKRKEKLKKLYWVDSEDEEEEEEDDEETEGVAIEVTAQPRPYTSSPPIPIPRRKVCCIDSLERNSRERWLLNQQRQVY